MFKVNDATSSSIASLSLLKKEMLRSQNNSTDLSNELNIAIGCEPSTVFCRKVKPDAAAYNSKCQFNLGFKTTSPFT